MAHDFRNHEEQGVTNLDVIRFLFRCYIYYLFKLAFWWLDQYLIPDMWQLVFANIFIQGWVIDFNQHGFSDGPSHVVVFPAHYAEVV